MNCRFCNNKLDTLFVTLGLSPLANSYLTKEQLHKPEPVYPLDVYVCDECFLVQLFEFQSPENIFSDYAYFSSYSQTCLKYAKEYVDRMTSLFGINKDSFVVEIASNDGYLLQYFIKKEISVLGIEPACNVAKVAQEKGVPTEVVFFGTATAKRLVSEGKSADLLLGNNVLAHVPDLNDFVRGMSILLKPEGIITMEFPHLLKLIEGGLFDTIYQEHFSYFSFLTAEKVFSAHGLAIFDVEELPTQGGSLRIYAKHTNDNTKPIAERVYKMLNKEIGLGFSDIKRYLTFDGQVKKIKSDILDFLTQAKHSGKTIVGYGAAAKGNTLLNYCGVKGDFIEYIADSNPYKQGRYLPGSHIPIESPNKIKETKPDYVLILPWNIKDEVKKQLSFIKDWGGKFVTFIPHVDIN